MISCTKSKEVHPEIGDGNDEIVTVGMKDVHVKYTRTDHAELGRVVFHYSLAQVQQFEAAEMTKQETFFELTLNDLLSDTLYDYYYELFYNGGESPKTEQKTFHTQPFDAPEPPEPPTPPTPPAPDVPEGAINGLFTINENGDQVYFSKGNLQYQASTNTWRFAENQWDYVGNSTRGTVTENGVKCDNTLISSTYSGWIDLFGWGTSGWNNGNVYYMPFDYQYIDHHEIGFGYGPTDETNYTFDLTGAYANADWGVYNHINNGGNDIDTWRTLTAVEWRYVFNYRTTPSNIRYAKAMVVDVSGVILLPDNWNSSIYSFADINEGNVPFTTNEISLSEWETMQACGAVFIPTAGRRTTGASVEVGDIEAIYCWSSSSYGQAGYAHCLCVEDDTYYEHIAHDRKTGLSVRLVQDVN